jgi:peptidoglycan/LPS O-acetylase OafA/YrhL
MIISITNAIQSTYIFIAILLVAIFASVRIKKNKDFFPIETTNELKGIAILMVVFGHIGYFLVNDHNFLFPLSIIAGVGVDIFLLLSGYGLVISSINKNRTVSQFYKDRLLKIFVPFWIVLVIFFLMDFLILQKAYSINYIISSFAGIFLSADLYKDINSPLWYFTLIFFYYLIFPLVFSKKRPWLSAIIIWFITYVFISINPTWFSQVRYFSQVHMLAFPLGMILAWFACRTTNFREQTAKQLENFFKKNLVLRILKWFGYIFLILALLAIAGYTSYNSGVGKGVLMEQLISTITALAFIFLFLIKKLDIKLFSLFGLYSYEIYLLHWPILYRYDIFFRYLPAWLAMCFYLILFLLLAWLLQKITKIILKIFL